MFFFFCALQLCLVFKIHNFSELQSTGGFILKTDQTGEPLGSGGQNHVIPQIHLHRKVTVPLFISSIIINPSFVLLQVIWGRVAEAAGLEEDSRLPFPQQRFPAPLEASRGLMEYL